VSSPQPIAVLGAGSWGTALAILLARQGRPVRLWGHHPDAVARLAAERANARYLPGFPFPPSLQPMAELAQVLDGVRDLLVVVPSGAFRGLLGLLRPLLTAEQRVAWACKGLEQGSAKLLHEIFLEELGAERLAAVVSGPTFAREVVRGLPTAVTVAASDPYYAAELADALHDERFRAYTSGDMAGVELGGALKNVLAIAAGIADGLGFGANARAALITRGLAELMRLGDACGGQRETFMGLAGLGDLVLTCTDDQSRNRRFGLALGGGMTPEQARASIDQVVEGIGTAREVRRRAEMAGVEMPICDQVYRVIYDGLDPQQAVHNLLNREQKAEL